VVDIDAAIGFVVARGDAVDRARLSHLRTGTAPPEEIFANAEQGQTESGGWPGKPGEAVGSVDATCLRLAELDDLSGLDRPAAQRALRWLVSRQRPDGCWEEDASLAESAPPWATPGDPEARFFLTASAAFWLCVADADGQVAAPDSPTPYGDAVERGADAIRERIDQTGAWPGFLVAGWLAAAVLHRTGSYYEAARMFVTLADRLPTMSPADTASMIAALRRAGVDAGDRLLVAARERLSEGQRPDGAWPSGDAIPFDVQTTLTALRALR
jgi:hypothetical protein